MEETPQSLAEIFRQEYLEDSKELGLGPGTHEFQVARDNWVISKIGQGAGMSISEMVKRSFDDFKDLNPFDMGDVTFATQHASGATFLHAMIWAAKNPRKVVKLSELLTCMQDEEEECSLGKFIEEMTTEVIVFLETNFSE